MANATAVKLVQCDGCGRFTNESKHRCSKGRKS